jgi:hypothetical protein
MTGPEEANIEAICKNIPKKHSGCDVRSIVSLSSLASSTN